MTTDATSDDLVMINSIGGDNPRGNRMASFADFCGSNMSRTFAGCLRSIMTGNTGFGCETMIKGRNLPRRCLVTGITSQRGWNMGRPFTRCYNSIVTAFTGTDDLRMIYQRINRAPYRGVMTGLANIASINVINGLTCCRGSIMTTDTGLT